MINIQDYAPKEAHHHYHTHINKRMTMRAMGANFSGEDSSCDSSKPKDDYLPKTDQELADEAKKKELEIKETFNNAGVNADTANLP